MSNVIGPYEQVDFRIMARLKQSIAWAKTQDPTKFGDGLRKNQGMLKYFIGLGLPLEEEPDTTERLAAQQCAATFRRINLRVLVCGDRNFSDTEYLYEILDECHKNRLIDVIIEGDARGADRIAGYWAKKNKIDLRIFPADWAKYGKAAGPIRNKQMLDEGKPDLVIAFLAPNSIGTANMLAQAQKAGVETKVIFI